MAAQQAIEAAPDAQQRNNSVSEEWSNDQYSLRVIATGPACMRMASSAISSSATCMSKAAAACRTAIPCNQSAFDRATRGIALRAGHLEGGVLLHHPPRGSAAAHAGRDLRAAGAPRLAQHLPEHNGAAARASQAHIGPDLMHSSALHCCYCVRGPAPITIVHT